MKRSKVITAVIAIIAVVAAACVYGYVRSKPADEPEKPAVTEPENPTTPETPDDSNSANRPIPRPMNLPYSRKTPIRAARSQGHDLRSG